MRAFNAIAVFDQTVEKLLFCKRRKEPYKGFYNFVGGKIEPGEDSISAAYRELKEETGITKEDIILTHLMDFTYHFLDMHLEIYVGRLNKPKAVSGDENSLHWISVDSDFFDVTRFAGDGNIGHIMRHIEGYKDEVL